MQTEKESSVIFHSLELVAEDVAHWISMRRSLEEAEQGWFQLLQTAILNVINVSLAITATFANTLSIRSV